MLTEVLPCVIYVRPCTITIAKRTNQTQNTRPLDVIGGGPYLLRLYYVPAHFLLQLCTIVQANSQLILLQL